MENHLSPSTAHHHHHHLSPPSTPVTISDPTNPYPTTFIQADTTSFKNIVQMLTGSSETIKQVTATGRQDTHPISLTKTGHNKKPSKLYERRNSFKSFKMLVPWNYNSPDILSPNLLDFPALMLSPVTPLLPDPFNGSLNLDHEAEEKAIKEKGFYLHPSPVSTPRRESELQLLPLFPVTSPKISGGSSCSNS